MTRTAAVATRELASYFRQPAGWIIIALYLFLAGLIFSTTILIPGRVASLRAFFELSGWLLLPVAPAISMRLIAEELRTGTIESLATTPITSLGLVLGKYAAACAFLLAMLIPTLTYPVVLWAFSDPKPDPGPIIAGYLCLFLLGMLYLAIGTLASTLTSNGTLAFLITLFAILALMFAGIVSAYVPAAVSPFFQAFWITPRIADFARGVIDTSHVAVFILSSAWLLCLAAASMEVRRWR
jgi:ABC-2 type transport system permease protein